MSGTSARESYRSNKRTRPSDSQPSRMTPPVLFRLPSVPMPGHDSAATASNVNSAAMAMPMAAAALSAGATSVSSMAATPAQATASSTPAPSAPALSAAATISGEKAAGQRLLNILIVVLLLAALAVITWISLNRGTTTPSLAENKVGNDSALSTLGELKVPEMASPANQTTSIPAATKVDEKVSGLNVDEIKPANPADLSLIDLPDSPNNSAKHESSEAESLLTGLDTSGTDSALANAPSSSSNSLSTPTAQIQLRTPVPMGNSNVTSLVDATKANGGLGGATFDSNSTARFETVSTPSQPAKIFPANTDPAQSSTAAPAASNKSSSSPTDGSPALWDGAQRTAPEGLQLSNKATTNNNSQTQVSISKPLSAEIAMTAAQPTANWNTANSNTTGTLTADDSQQGATVGGGAPEPYNLAEKVVPAAENLNKSRADLNPTMLARVAASGAAKSAASNSASLPANASKPINSYAAAANANTAGQNLYTNGYVNQAPAGSTAPINTYALQNNVPPGVTGSGSAPYMPPTTSMPNAAGQYPTNQQQLVSGPNSAPTSMASYAIPPRSNATTNNQVGVQSNPAYTQQQQQQQRYQQPTAPAGYAQPGMAQPNYQQPGYQQPGYVQPGYAQPTAPPAGYGQPNAYGQPNPYGAGSGYANPAYATPSTGPSAQNMPAANMPGMSMPSGGYQRNASYPTNNPIPGGQVSVGLIGPAGNATPPSGDIRPIDVMGTGGVRTSTPYGSPQ